MITSTSLFVQDEHGNEQEMEILFTFEDDSRNKKYVVFKHPGEDSEVFASIYDEVGNLLPIETQEEWDMIEEIIGAFEDEESEE